MFQFLCNNSDQTWFFNALLFARSLGTWRMLMHEKSCLIPILFVCSSSLYYFSGVIDIEVRLYSVFRNSLQSTLIISNSKGPSETLWDIRTSTYQIFRIEEKIIQTTTFNKFIWNWTLDIRDISKILWKRGVGAISPLFHNIFYLLLDFHV